MPGFCFRVNMSHAPIRSRLLQHHRGAQICLFDGMTRRACKATISLAGTRPRLQPFRLSETRLRSAPMTTSLAHRSEGRLVATEWGGARPGSQLASPPSLRFGTTGRFRAVGTVTATHPLRCRNLVATARSPRSLGEAATLMAVERPLTARSQAAKTPNNAPSNTKTIQQSAARSSRQSLAVAAGKARACDKPIALTRRERSDILL
jgi:hypothetical protein